MMEYTRKIILKTHRERFFLFTYILQKLFEMTDGKDSKS